MAKKAPPSTSPNPKRSPSEKSVASLHRAAKDGDAVTLGKLLEAGADPNEINSFGVTALHVACNEGHEVVVRTLLAAPKIDVDRREVMEDRTPLHLAARAGQLRIVELLLAAGAKPELADRDGENALMKCVSFTPCVSVILVHAARTGKAQAISSAAERLQDETPAHRAALCDNGAVLQLLINSGAPVDAKNFEDNTPLHIASASGHSACARLLLDAGASLALVNVEGRTPLDEALHGGHTSLAEMIRNTLNSRTLASLRKKGVRNWDASDCLAWLDAVGYAQYRPSFQKRAITGEQMVELNADELRGKLGIKNPLHCKDISQLLTSIRSPASALPSAPTIDAGELVFDTELLGKGNFGEVRRAVWRDAEVAVKIIYRSLFRSQSDFELFQKEVAILSHVRHPNIIEFLGVTTTPQGNPGIVTRFMARGSLHSLIHKNFWVLEHEAGLRERIVLDVCSGMAHLHSLRPAVIHRDLNARNVLLDAKMHAVVADLGLSRFKEDDGKMTNKVGCLPWTAPEVFRGEPYNEKADVYSFAMLLFELLTAREPHDEGDVPAQLFAERAAFHGERPSLPPTLPPFWAALIRRCWVSTPTDRPSFASVLEEVKAASPSATLAADFSRLSLTAPPAAQVSGKAPVYLDG